MAVVLTILKILGIILLVILGLLLLLLLLVLFVPIRYRLTGGYNEEYLGAEVNVRWLIFRVLGSYTKSDGLKVRAKAAWFTVYKLDKREEARKETEHILNPDNPENALPPPEKETGDQKKAAEDETETVEVFGDGKPESKSGDKAKKKKGRRKAGALEKKDKQKETAGAKPEVLEGEVENEPEEEFLNKLEEMRDKLETKMNHISSFLAKDFTERTIERGKKLLKKVFLHLKPTKGRVDLTLGLGSSADTGIMLGKIARFYPLYGRWLFITPDFYYKRLEADGDIKGRIRIGSLAIPGLIFILRKDTRRTIKLAKKI